MTAPEIDTVLRAGERAAAEFAEGPDAPPRRDLTAAPVPALTALTAVRDELVALPDAGSGKLDRGEVLAVLRRHVDGLVFPGPVAPEEA